MELRRRRQEASVDGMVRMRKKGETESRLSLNAAAQDDVVLGRIVREVQRHRRTRADESPVRSGVHDELSCRGRRTLPRYRRAGWVHLS